MVQKIGNRARKHVTIKDIDQIQHLIAGGETRSEIREKTGRALTTIKLMAKSSSVADYKARAESFYSKYKHPQAVQTSISLPVEARKDKTEKPVRPEYPVSNIAPALWAINNTLKQILERTPRRGIFG